MDLPNENDPLGDVDIHNATDVFDATDVYNAIYVPKFIFAGRLTRDFTILPSGKALIDVPGGEMLYSAAGLLVWEPDPAPGLVARVGEDYPQQWLEDFRRRGADITGIRVLPEAVDLRNFYVSSDKNPAEWSISTNEDPVTFYSRSGIPFPKELLGYRQLAKPLDSRTQLLPISLRQSDLPSEYLDATAAHLCPVDFLTHTLLPAVLRQAGFTTVTLDPSSGYMNPIFWDDIPTLLTGLTAFLPSEGEARSLFHGRSTDLWEIAEGLASYGCEMIVIKRGLNGVLVYEAAGKKRWEIPAYPVKRLNPSGAGSAFCGGFLAGYCRTYDPLEAALYGSISASLTVEGNTPFYPIDVLPGLPEARLEALRQTTRKR